MNTTASAAPGAAPDQKAPAEAARPLHAPAFEVPTIRIRRIVVPVDFSPPTAKAVTYAQSLAMTYGAAITLLHVFVPPFVPYEPVVGGSIMTVIQTVRQQVEDQLKDLCQTIAQEVSVPVDAQLLDGPVHRRITEVCKEIGADLIIMPTHGYTGLQHALHLGSTAERVVRHAPCPVMVVREVEQDFVTT